MAKDIKKSRSPAPVQRIPSAGQVTRSPPQTTPAVSKRKGYGSERVKDNDIFLLPASDYQWMGALTAIGAAVRLFRIYQPTSVVFDEVQ
jgi:dolichyl-phosphate-mannose-protein mannosyltransferase